MLNGDRNISPADQPLPFQVNDVGENAFTLRARIWICRQEHLTDAVRPIFQGLEAEKPRLFLKELMRELHLNTSAISCQWIRPGRRAMPESMQHFEALLHDASRFLSADVSDEPHPAGRTLG